VLKVDEDGVGGDDAADVLRYLVPDEAKDGGGKEIEGL